LETLDKLDTAAVAGTTPTTQRQLCYIDITKAIDTSGEIIDIMNTPDVATWNKGIQIKGDVAEVVKQSNEAERTTKTTPTTINSGPKKMCS